MFKPNLSILPEPQRQLWAELRNTPKTFVLYGGTALALRIGHRQSEDFDFFSNRPFDPNLLRDTVSYLKHAEMTQFQDNTLTAVVDRNGPVKLSFFGSLGIKRVQDPDVVEENGVQVASMLDLLASKLKTVQLRAQAKDYRDVLGTLDAGLSLVFCIVNVFTNSGNSAYWQYASSSRAQTVPHGFGSQAVTGDQSSSQHAPRDCSPPRHCPWGGRGNCQSRSGAQPIYVSAHRIAVSEAI